MTIRLKKGRGEHRLWRTEAEVDGGRLVGWKMVNADCGGHTEK